MAVHRILLFATPATVLIVLAGVVFGGESAGRAAPTASGPVRPSDAQAAKAFDRYLRTDWHGVYLLGQKMGWMKGTFSKSPDGRSYQLATTFHTRLSTMNTEQVMEVEETRVYRGPGWRLTRIEMTQTAGGRPAKMIGQVVGDEFEFTTTLAGKSSVKKLPVPKESLTDALRLQLIAQDPATKPGARFTYRQFDATIAQEFDCDATIVKREEVVLEGIKTPVVDIHTDIKLMGLTTTARLTPDGRLLEGSIAVMFKLRLESEEVAKKLDIPLDPLALGTIRIKRELPDVTKIRELGLGLSGLDDARFVLESERRQYKPTDTPGEYTLTLRRDKWGADDVVKGPYDREKFKNALAATPFIQCDDPKIIALAKEIVGEETDPVERVGRIVAWVYKSLDKQYTAALSSALDVLETRAGDCTEHTILFVALCRAAGIPAEEVAGVIYGQGFGGFVYHAWARVYIGKWIEADPTFDETVAHPAHIAFAVGPLEKQAALVNLIGKVKLRFVSITMDTP